MRATILSRKTVAKGRNLSLHAVNVELRHQRILGQKAADEFTNAFGPWTYIIIQTVVIIV